MDATNSGTLLPLFFAAVVSFAVMMYVLLDGFDLGIGILFPWVQDESQRDIMINTIAPVWDGNETWLVLGAAVLYGAFPSAYSGLLPILYLPLMLMLCSLIFRGVAFEFRFKAGKTKILWDIAFSAGATIAAFCQGIVLGTFVHGFKKVPTGYGGSWHWLSTFSIITGLGVLCGYALLGSTWLILKTEGELQRSMRYYAKLFIVLVAIFMAVVSIWTPFIDPRISTRWFSLPNFYFLAPLPILTAICLIALFISLFKHNDREPFVLSMLTFFFGYIGLVISSWPYIIPRVLTIWQAASNKDSLQFLLVGVVILLPVLCAYSIYAYWVFKGKVRGDEGYH